ncbi:hypothetical protein ZWY2020_043711 [Hordeum vulgare]|nr:hypothetical protein ZWY2020_043711 [Hordeum vulgare]
MPPSAAARLSTTPWPWSRESHRGEAPSPPSLPGFCPRVARYGSLLLATLFGLRLAGACAQVRGVALVGDGDNSSWSPCRCHVGAQRPPLLFSKQRTTRTQGCSQARRHPEPIRHHAQERRRSGAVRRQPPRAQLNQDPTAKAAVAGVELRLAGVATAKSEPGPSRFAARQLNSGWVVP